MEEENIVKEITPPQNAKKNSYFEKFFNNYDDKDSNESEDERCLDDEYERNHRR